MKTLINTTKNPHRFEIIKDKKVTEVYLGIEGDYTTTESGVVTGERADRIKVDDAVYKELKTQKIFCALLDRGDIVEGMA